MLSHEEKKYLRSKLPHGSCKRIAEMVGVAQQSITYFFRGDYNSERIERAAMEVYDEVRKADKKKRSKLSK